MKVKICGITDQRDAELAAELGAWALGFVFWEGSPRAVSPRKAAAIIARLPASVLPVGVFVDATIEQLRRTASETGIRAYQLHGRAAPAAFGRLDLPVIRAVRPRRPSDLDRLSSYPPLFGFLVDAAVRGARGGTGRLADWGLARAAKQFGRVFLAGGLDAGNIREAVRSVRPFAVDLSSGVEARPGR
ncbi:MAG TPA: phosphoribosylanthranilate isomerase, partial [Elusimicrobiales bacterium]|nr:phosphoribosylanthranilate isomerase [Elusimicrobiales bacterium]